MADHDETGKPSRMDRLSGQARDDFNRNADTPPEEWGQHNAGDGGASPILDADLDLAAPPIGPDINAELPEGIDAPEPYYPPPPEPGGIGWQEDAKAFASDVHRHALPPRENDIEDDPLPELDFDAAANPDPENDIDR